MLRFGVYGQDPLRPMNKRKLSSSSTREQNKGLDSSPTLLLHMENVAREDRKYYILQPPLAPVGQK